MSLIFVGLTIALIVGLWCLRIACIAGATLLALIAEALS